MESAVRSKRPLICSAACSAEDISSHKRLIYLPNTAREKTSEEKLQYVHLVRQKGTEMYNPSDICIIIEHSALNGQPQTTVRSTVVPTSRKTGERRSAPGYLGF